MTVRKRKILFKNITVIIRQIFQKYNRYEKTNIKNINARERIKKFLKKKYLNGIVKLDR
jgi:ABC-type phosphate transport system ATPase subunit